MNPDIIKLVSIRDIGRVRARKLYDAGFHSISDLKNTDVNTLTKYLGPKIAVKVLEQLGVEPENNKPLETESNTVQSYPDNQGQKTFNDF